MIFAPEPFPIILALTGFAIFVQTAELLAVRRTLSERGIWRPEIIRRAYSHLPGVVRWPLLLLLSYSGFLAVLLARLFCSVLLPFHLGLLPILVVWLATLLIILRFRGPFNGGSDYMTLVIIHALLLNELFPTEPLIALATLYFIAVQSCCSYFIAGVVKLRTKEWRDGSALPTLIHYGGFVIPGWIIQVLNVRTIAIAVSWGVILFECTFPVALFHPHSCLALIIIAFTFHAINSAVLGLNRFLHIWTATYPAIYWCSITTL